MSTHWPAGPFLLEFAGEVVVVECAVNDRDEAPLSYRVKGPAIVPTGKVGQGAFGPV